jgi:predicted N-acetyltransferase YhbS
MSSLELTIAPERLSDASSITQLEERAFGPGRFARSAYRLREAVPHDPALSFVARVGTLVVGSVRLTPVKSGSAKTFLLGPLTVEPAFRGRGIGVNLLLRAIEAARGVGADALILVGDEPYYARVGFKRVPTHRLRLPGPVDPTRVLCLPLTPDAMERLGTSLDPVPTVTPGAP